MTREDLSMLQGRFVKINRSFSMFDTPLINDRDINPDTSFLSYHDSGSIFLIKDCKYNDDLDLLTFEAIDKDSKNVYFELTETHFNEIEVIE